MCVTCRRVTAKDVDAEDAVDAGRRPLELPRNAHLHLELRALGALDRALDSERQPLGRDTSPRAITNRCSAAAAITASTFPNIPTGRSVYPDGRSTKNKIKM